MLLWKSSLSSFFYKLQFSPSFFLILATVFPRFFPFAIRFTFLPSAFSFKGGCIYASSIPASVIIMYYSSSPKTPVQELGVENILPGFLAFYSPKRSFVLITVLTYSYRIPSVTLNIHDPPTKVYTPHFSISFFLQACAFSFRFR